MLQKSFSELPRMHLQHNVFFCVLQIAIPSNPFEMISVKSSCSTFGVFKTTLPFIIQNIKEHVLNIKI